MSGTPEHPSLFDRVFDVVILGAGHAGYAATLALRAKKRSVLLIAAGGDLVWESGRAFHPDAGDCDDPLWHELVGSVARRGGHAAGWLDGAITEIVATDRIVSSDASVLYYARAVAVDREGDGVAGLIVATKSGTRRVVGRQWIDATESGELLRLLHADESPRPPEAVTAHLMLQHRDWRAVSTAGGVRPTAWPTERVLTVGVDVRRAWRTQVLDALGDLEGTMGADLADVSMSHLSLVPVPSYATGTAAAPIAAVNVATAVPGLSPTAVTTLADRFQLGTRAAHALSELDIVEPSADTWSSPVSATEPAETIRRDVCVVGTGTGGALASIAASMSGATVVSVEAAAFLGGIGTGGGIHAYCFGVPGGLQQVVDQRTRELMRRFRRGPLADGPFNPWAKMIALEQMLHERDVDVRTEALLCDVDVADGRVTAAMVATERGVVRIEAEAFVDGTGDGDLCALAGAAFTFGREHDALPHAYTQSSGRLRMLNNRPRMQLVNFDAGYCDPTDPEDITRARVIGVRQYLLDAYDNLTRPTYVAPALGLRQSRQVTTEYVLTLDDQIRRRRFDDAIGYSGAFFDNHGSDYEFESDEALFWVWANRQWSAKIGCELSYRMLVPRGLSNVWIASRCLGATQDAHYTTRMQRDIQRVGEVAGFAAAQAAIGGRSAQELSHAQLRAWLDRTGVMENAPCAAHEDFGPAAGGDDLAAPGAQSSAAKALAALDRGEPGVATWWLYRHEELVRDAVIARLDAKDTPFVSWLAACIVAMWGDAAAEPRLTEAIGTVEYGFGGAYPAQELHGRRLEPLTWSKVVPNWLCAVALLRRCGTQDCLPAIERLLELPVHGVNTLTTVALTLERLADRLAGDDADAADRVAAMLDRLVEVETVGTVDCAGRHVGRYGELAIRGEPAPAVVDMAAVPMTAVPEMVANSYEDNSWQLHLVVARTRAALGLPPHDAAAPYRHDDRALVRKAFSAAPAVSPAVRASA